MGEISVDLRLKLDKLRADASKAGQDINSGLASSIKGLRSNSEIAAEKERRINRDALTAKRVDLMEADKMRGTNDKARFERMMMASMLPMLRPTSPWGAFFASRQAFQAFQGTEAGQNAMGRAGLSGNAGAATAATVLTLAALGVGMALKGLKTAIEGVTRAADEARRTYAKILQSGGMAPGFVIQRQQLAQVMGVSDDAVWQYGTAIAFLNSKLEWSTSILTETNPTVTALGWEFQVTSQNMKALWAQLANDAAPAVNAFLKSLDGLIKFLHANTWAVEKDVGGVFKSALNMVLPSLGPWLGVAGTAAKAIGTERAPSPTVSINRLPASAWEKMGLIIGGGGMAVDHQKKIANNTNQMVQILNRIANAAGVPRSGNFFDNPMYAQP